MSEPGRQFGSRSLVAGCALRIPNASVLQNCAQSETVGRSLSAPPYLSRAWKPASSTMEIVEHVMVRLNSDLPPLAEVGFEIARGRFAAGDLAGFGVVVDGLTGADGHIAQEHRFREIRGV